MEDVGRIQERRAGVIDDSKCGSVSVAKEGDGAGSCSLRLLHGGGAGVAWGEGTAVGDIVAFLFSHRCCYEGIKLVAGSNCTVIDGVM